MKRLSLSFVFVLLAIGAVAGLHLSDVAHAQQGQPARGKIVVANRGEGSISVIDTKLDETVEYPLPAGENPSEPMYVVDVSAKNRVFVGDRANDRVVVFNARNFSVEATVDTGRRGLPHVGRSEGPPALGQQRRRQDDDGHRYADP